MTPCEVCAESLSDCQRHHLGVGRLFWTIEHLAACASCSKVLDLLIDNDGCQCLEFLYHHKRMRQYTRVVQEIPIDITLSYFDTPTFLDLSTTAERQQPLTALREIPREVTFFEEQQGW